MKIDEAIKDIKENIKPVVGGVSLDMAIEALEKNLIETPVYAWCEELDAWTCPRCHGRYFENFSHYCWCCGQALNGDNRDRSALKKFRDEQGVDDED